MTTDTPGLDPELLAILACPQCRAPLDPVSTAGAVEALRCTSDTCGLVYPVRDGIPVLLVDEAWRADG